MRDNIGFILTFTAMLCAIAYLSGCTQFDKRDAQVRNWDIEMISTEEECRMTVNAHGEDTQEDDSVEIKHPAGG